MLRSLFIPTIVRDRKDHFTPPLQCNGYNLTSSNLYKQQLVTYMFDDQYRVQDLYGHLPMLHILSLPNETGLLNNSINLLAHLPFPQTCIWMAKACTKINPMHDPHSTHTHKNKNQKPIVWCQHFLTKKTLKICCVPQNK